MKKVELDTLGLLGVDYQTNGTYHIFKFGGYATLFTAHEWCGLKAKDVLEGLMREAWHDGMHAEACSRDGVGELP